MSQVITQYTSLYESLRSRRLRPELPKGLDMAASRVRTFLGHRAHALPHLLRKARDTDTLAPEFRGMSEAALDDAISRVREDFLRGRESPETVCRALASTREVARRITGEEAYPVQLAGALGLYHGRVVEMLTGEGKTLTGSIAAPLIAWRRRHLHILTVNDYLPSRYAL